MAVTCTYVYNKYEIPMGYDILLFVTFAIFSFGMTRIWQHWIDNPEDYEKIQQARIRRIGGRMGRDRRDGTESKEKKSKE